MEMNGMIHVSCSFRCHLLFPVEDWDICNKNKDFAGIFLYRSEIYNNTTDED